MIGALASNPTIVRREGQVVSGARAIVWSLEELGVTHVFGIPGGNVMPLYDELLSQTGIRHILVRHEQGAGHAAQGFAIASSSVGVAIATSGPGATNLVTAISDAYANSVPLVAITGQVMSDLMGTDAFQEADIVGISIPITKHAVLVSRAEEIPEALAEAFRIAMSGRPGPVVVDIAKDAQQGLSPFRWKPIHESVMRPSRAYRRQCAAAVQMISQSRRPVLHIGGGVVRSNASRELLELVNLTGIPVVTSLTARGAFPDSDPRNLGMMGLGGSTAANLAVQNSDLIIAIASQIDESSLRDRIPLAAASKLIHIDIDPSQISRRVRADVPIVGDAAEILAELIASLGEVNSANIADWVSMLSRLRADIRRTEVSNDDRLTASFIVDRIATLTGPEAIYTVDAGDSQMIAAQAIHLERPNSWQTSTDVGSTGQAVPAAMGAKLAEPNREVWAIADRAGFERSNQELATCAVNGIPIKVAILNDGSPTSTAGRMIPDFVTLGEAYRAHAIRVRTRDEVDTALALALATTDRVVIIDFVLSTLA